MTQKDIFGKRLNQLKMTLSEQTRKEKKNFNFNKQNAIRMGADPGFIKKKTKKKSNFFFLFKMPLRNNGITAGMIYT